jgi:hypothetical protein
VTFDPNYIRPFLYIITASVQEGRESGEEGVSHVVLKAKPLIPTPLITGTVA